jgi:isochorismate synthase
VVGAGAVLRALRTSYPSCFTYLVPGSDGTALVGATPELLVRRSGLVASSQPMAGSARRGADEGEDEALAAALLASPKDRHEHAVVVAAMVEALSPLARRVEASDTPEVVRFTNIQHLATTLRAELADPPANALEVCAALQPTPAVGGAPLAPALALIDELEGLERGWYAGAVGWMDAGGDGEFAVALRCGLLWEDGARLYAGVGVMADSDASAELAETELKLRALIGALGG